MTQTPDRVRLRLIEIDDTTNEPRGLLLDQITDTMSAYTTTRDIAHQRARERGASDDQIARLDQRLARLSDEPAPAPDESHTWVLMNKPSRLVIAVIWPGTPETDPEFA